MYLPHLRRKLATTQVALMFCAVMVMLLLIIGGVTRLGLWLFDSLVGLVFG